MAEYRHQFAPGEKAIWNRLERGERLPVIVKETGDMIRVEAEIAGCKVAVYVDPTRLQKIRED